MMAHLSMFRLMPVALVLMGMTFLHAAPAGASGDRAPKSKAPAVRVVTRTPTAKNSERGMWIEPVIVRKNDNSGPMMTGGEEPWKVSRSWVECWVSATSLSFAVLRPGQYAARWSSLGVRSNTTVILDFDRFGNLINSSSGREIPMELGMSDGGTTPGQVPFCSAEEFNGRDVHLTQTESRLFQCDLWTRIHVKRTASAGEYVRVGMITVVLENVSDYSEAPVNSSD
jgi:hypothetical protein